MPKTDPAVSLCVLCDAMIVAVGKQAYELPAHGERPSLKHTCELRPYADRTTAPAVATLQALAAGEAR